MHLIEIRQTLHDTSAERDIYDISKISRKLAEFAEFTEDLNYTDFAYITSLTSKAKTLLYRAYTIFKINNEEVQKNDKQK